MTNLFEYRFHFERVDVLVFACHKHTGDSCYVKVTDFFNMFAVFKVTVHETYSEEEGLIITFEIGEYFNHPVNHSCP